uniref:DUF2135 domain-containing protein n=1 Tax=Meloidogyne hapla TaxID=6305 RepID=A0A1I8B731_MELHA
MHIEGTVTCLMELNAISVPARLQGARIEFWEEDTPGSDDDLSEEKPTTDFNGEFKLSGNIYDGPFTTPDPYILVFHECYSPKSESPIIEGYHYRTWIYLEPKEGKIELNIKVGKAEAAEMIVVGEDKHYNLNKITTQLIKK